MANEQKTILQRVHALAESESESFDNFADVAKIARKLSTNDNAAEKAHAMHAVLRRYPDDVQTRLLTALEVVASGERL